MGFVVWLGIAVIMAVVEVASQGLITAWFVVGALVAFAANVLGFDLIVQIVVFLVVSVGCLVALRPVFLKYRARGQSEEPTMIGRFGVVVEDIDNVHMAGRVETSDHMSWAARSASGEPIESGAPVRVVAQESVKLIVERVVA